MIRLATKAVLLGEGVDVEGVLVPDQWWILSGEVISDAGYNQVHLVLLGRRQQLHYIFERGWKIGMHRNDKAEEAPEDSAAIGELDDRKRCHGISDWGSRSAGPRRMIRRGLYQLGEDRRAVGDVDFRYSELIGVQRAKDDVCMGMVRNLSVIGRGFLRRDRYRAGHSRSETTAAGADVLMLLYRPFVHSLHCGLSKPVIVWTKASEAPSIVTRFDRNIVKYINLRTPHESQ